MKLDPFVVEVIRHGLSAAAEEMSLVMTRSARSPLLREACDLSSAITDHKGDLIAQGRDIPIHLGVMSFTVKKFLERVPAERLRQGDVWFLNLPEVGGNHLPDVKAIRPVFAGGRLAAFAINLAHWADIGGAVPGSYVPWADEAVQEGLRIAPIKVFDRKGPTRALDLIMANLRGREERKRARRSEPGLEELLGDVLLRVRVAAERVELRRGVAHLVPIPARGYKANSTRRQATPRGLSSRTSSSPERHPVTAEKIKQLMADNLTWVGSWSDVDDDYPLLEKHVIDSLGMVKLISVLEEEFGIEIDDEDVVPDNWQTIASITALVDAKRQG